MSRLMKGDLISNFGTYLPAPYIDKIEVTDDSVVTYMSVFLVASGDEGIDDDAVITDLNSNANIYCLHAWYPSSSIDQADLTYGYAENDWQNVVSGDTNVFKAYSDYSNQITFDFRDLYTRLTKLPSDMNSTGSNWSKTEDTFTESGHRILKFQTEVVYNFGLTEDEIVDGAFGSTTTAPSENPEFWYTFAFTSTYDYSEEDIDDVIENLNLLSNRTSNISYEKVFSEGKIRRLYADYFDSEGILYDDIPLRSLAGRYYETDTITHDEIIEYFSKLAEDYEKVISSDDTTLFTSDEGDTLQDILNNILYILSEYGYKVDLLVQLNYLREVFPSKSNADVVGRLYLRYTKRLLAVNATLENGTALTKKVVRSPKIRDLRDYTGDEDYDNSYFSDWENNHNHYLYDNHYMAQYSYPTTPGHTAQTYYNKGFCFFDYEKAYRETSELSQIVDVNKLIQLWGFEPIYSKFKILYADIGRNRSDNTNTLTTTLYDNTLYPRSKYYTWSSNEDEGDEGSAPNSYIVLRNMLPINENPLSFGSTIDNYYMTAFEFRDVFGTYDPDRYGGYTVNVVIEDNSFDVLQELITHYLAVYEELEDYYDSAAEYCSVDTETQQFKPFFVEAMDNLYGDSPESTPWYRAAVLYNMHKDLLFNTFDGDVELLLENVQDIVDSINPYTGDLTSLGNFKVKYEEFYIDNYASSAPGLEGAEELHTPSMCPYESGCCKSTMHGGGMTACQAHCAGLDDDAARAADSGCQNYVAYGDLYDDADYVSDEGLTAFGESDEGSSIESPATPDWSNDLYASTNPGSSPSSTAMTMARMQDLLNEFAEEAQTYNDDDSGNSGASADADATDGGSTQGAEYDTSQNVPYDDDDPEIEIEPIPINIPEDDSNILIFTNTYSFADLEPQEVTELSGETTSYWSYRSSWATGGDSYFRSAMWEDWVDQVEEHQGTIADDRGSEEIESLLYLWMADLMETALDGGVGWADIVTTFDETFSGETDEKSAWGAILAAAAAGFGLGLLGGALGATGGALIGGASAAIVVAFKSSDEDGITFTLTNEDTGEETDITLPTGVWEQISDDTTAIGGATRGWLRYMWGAIKNDGVLEPSDVSSGYST